MPTVTRPLLRQCLLLGWLCLGSTAVHAQLSTLRTRRLAPGPAVAPLDSLTVLPGSVTLLAPADTSIHLTFDPATNALAVRGARDSVLVQYRTFAFDVGRARFRRSLAAYDSLAFYDDRLTIARPTNRPADRREEFFSTRGLNKTGSLTRGLSAGNTQNVFVSSALNLQLEGQLTSEISLTAVISDQNVPFQPEGNTQQLQQFDRVFVQLGYQSQRRPSTRATLAVGDIVMRPLTINPRGEPSQFLRYYKNVQGGQVAATYQLSPSDSNQTSGPPRAARRGEVSAGVAVAKGKFASILVEALEGTQGPYRLRGPNNERFIIALANSEKVFLDGQLLRRGFNFDYIIDYNLAEVTFNPSVVITRFSRIRVDFEYADRNYSRTVTNAQVKQNVGRFNAFAGFYSERDNPNNPLLLTLSDADKRLLSQIGDSLDRAVASGATLLPAFDPNLVLYRLTDTTAADGRAYPGVYVYDTNPATARYQLQLTDLGPGRGNYQLRNTTVNGRVYQWVAPANGVPQGNFEPVRPLPPPNSRQMLTAGGDFAIGKNEAVFGEMALSERDQNLYSRLDKADDRGTAWKVGYVNRGRAIPFWKGYEWTGQLDLERDSRNFRPIDRFRDIEFDRDWSANPDSARAIDQILNVGVGVRRSIPSTGNEVVAVNAGVGGAAVGNAGMNNGGTGNGGVGNAGMGNAGMNNVGANNSGVNNAGMNSAVVNSGGEVMASGLPTSFGGAGVDRLLYRFSHRLRGAEVNGTQHRVEWAKTLGHWQWSGNFFALRNQRAAVRSDWQRLRTEVSYLGHKLTPGYVYSLDRNALVARNDSVVGTAMNFDEHRLYLRSGDSLRTRFLADYAYRRDDAPLAGRLVRNNLAHTASLALNTRTSRGQDLNLTLTYRRLQNLNLRPGDAPAEETVMGRVDWNADLLSHAVRSELSFAVATGRELRRAYVFLPVPVGQGTHTWRDLNGDGIKDLNEFLEAVNFDERTYAKFFVPTDQYTRAFTNNFNYRLTLTPPRAWRAGGPVLAWLARLSAVAAWNINKRHADDRLWQRFAPFAAVTRANLLANQESLRATVFFDRTRPGRGGDASVLRSEQTQLLTNGFESRLTQEYKINARANLLRQWNARLGLTRSFRTTASDFLQSRNYRLETNQARPELTFQPNNDFRLTTSYAYARKRNVFTEATAERAVVQEAGLETRWTRLNERTLTANFRYVRIDFTGGDANTALGYEMLESLRPGNNLTWGLNWQQRLTSGLQLSLTYEGRRPATAPVVHIGRVQVTALF